MAQVSPPFNTGGGGNNFETRVQASFVILMLAGGVVPGIRPWPITKIQFQGKRYGFNLDDILVYIQNPSNGEVRKLLCQIKHSTNITKSNPIFKEVIKAAWDDFNNEDIFTKNKDGIALITGPLTKIDTDHFRPLLEWAKLKTEKEFFSDVAQTFFCSDKMREKLETLRTHVKKANNQVNPSDKDFHFFLRHFHHLGYDLDIRSGVSLSLLHSIIIQHNVTNVTGLWSQVVEAVRDANQSGASITRDDIPEDIREAFIKPVIKTIPSAMAFISAPQITPTHDLALANLLGGWSEKKDADKSIVSILSKQNYDAWQGTMREALNQKGTPLQFSNGRWTIPNRLNSWKSLGSNLFEEDVELFYELALIVFKEHDPMFTLPREERYAAAIHGKVLSHSNVLRKGMATSLALLGSSPVCLTKFTPGKAEGVAHRVVLDVLQNASWILWASLNSLLPLLAEAAPRAFLESVDNAIHQDSCPFDGVFAQEGNNELSSSNYITGLLWALEALAWSEVHFVSVLVSLGKLAERDPGGNWANRPINSLTNILLPWMPQTTAPLEKRIVAINALRREAPDSAWNLLLRLLPRVSDSSSGTYKPQWRPYIPEDWTDTVTTEEYNKQLSLYADITVDMAKEDMDRLEELLGEVHRLPDNNFNDCLKYLGSHNILQQTQDVKGRLWEKLYLTSLKHYRHPTAKWSMGKIRLKIIDSMLIQLAPQDPLITNRHLFSTRDYDFYEKEEDWSKQQQILWDKKKHAIQLIIEYGDIEAVISFADTVENPFQVGLALGEDSEIEVDSQIIPDLLTSPNDNLKYFAEGFVRARCLKKGWTWINGLDMSSWTSLQIASFFVQSFFNHNTWKRIAVLLNENENEYWHLIDPIKVDEKDLAFVVDKLLQHNRPSTAIRLLRYSDKQDIPRIVQALKQCATISDRNLLPPYYDITGLIKVLQQSNDVKNSDLVEIEIIFLPLLDEDSGVYPVTLEKEISQDPVFFHEMIRQIYYSKDEPKHKRQKKSKQDQLVAERYYDLLYKWKTPPGLHVDGSFSGDELESWTSKVIQLCDSSGHLEVALLTMGKIFLHVPADPTGLWIHQSAAKILNDPKMSDIRRGFATAIYNSRGVHWVDPTGAPEYLLADQWEQKAEQLEEYGYQRLAETIRGVATDYIHQAEQIVAEHKHNKD